MIGALPGGHITLYNPSQRAEPVLAKLQEMGVKIWQDDNSIEVKAPPILEPTDVMTWPYPGFPTDSQAPFMALSCFADGRSIIRERLYENRFQHAAELQRMGADILVHHDMAVVNGPARLRGADVRATDLQAGVALVLAAVGAEGPTTIHNFVQVERGYGQLGVALNAIGTSLTPVSQQ